MGESSKIEWTDHTFNAWEGCQKVGPGCDHCYAEARNLRFAAGANWGPHAPRRRTSPANWREPLKWDRAAAKAGTRARVFCSSLADVFDNHPSILGDWRSDLWRLIQATPNLDWLLLTKRPGNIERYLPAFMRPFPNLWLGCTVVNQAEADRDIPKLLAVPAKVRFLSMEPLLGPVDLGPPVRAALFAGKIAPGGDTTKPLSWVIVGGESGKDARPMHPDWARALRDQCQAAGVAFHFKQWGEWSPVEIEEDDEGNLGAAYAVEGCSDPTAHRYDQECLLWQGDRLVHWPHIETAKAIGARKVGKSRAGRLLDGREWNEVPNARP